MSQTGSQTAKNGFVIHTPETAPEGSRERLLAAKEKRGFIPNLWAVQAEAPALLEGYQTLDGIFSRSSFTPTERQVVMLTASRENGCTYCMAAHTGLAKMDKVAEEVIAALREDRSIPDVKLEALRTFTRALVNKRGWVDAADLDAFFAAGYGRQQALEVILGVAVKTMSNYTNHIADTPVNGPTAKFAWTPPEKKGASAAE